MLVHNLTNNKSKLLCSHFNIEVKLKTVESVKYFSCILSVVLHLVNDNLSFFNIFEKNVKVFYLITSDLAL